jgi:hypothetical protein
MTATGQSAATRRPRRLSFSVGRVIAEPKRRSFVAVLVVLLVGGAIGGSIELQSTSHFGTTRSLTSAFSKDTSTEAWGRPSWALDGFTELRFIPSAPFDVGVVLHNESSQPLALTDVRAVLQRNSVVRQIGTRIVAFNPVCRTPSCPAPGFLDSRQHVVMPSALQVAPGKAAGVQLNFRFLGCPQARHGSTRNVHRIAVTYRDPAGTIIRQRVGLGGSTLKIDTRHPCSR